MRWTLFLMLAGAAPLAAQEDTPVDARQALVRIPEGTTLRVRLHTDGPHLAPGGRMARVAWMRDDSVRFAWVRQLDARTVAWRDVAHVDTLGTRVGTRATAGTVVGATLGVAVGFVGAVLATYDDQPEDASTQGDAVVILVGSTVLVALLGRQVGRAIPGGRGWVRVWP